jgi:hypothetical protein
MEYVHWLAQVNVTLGRLSNHLFTAEDFDYPWIEAHLKDTPPDQAAKEALADDGFIVENLPAPAMLIFSDREALYAQLDAIKDVQERIDACIRMYQAGEIRDEQLWRLLGDEYGPFSATHARKAYERMGFVPFAGFPLVKLRPEPDEGRKEGVLYTASACGMPGAVSDSPKLRGNSNCQSFWYNEFWGGFVSS